MTTKFKVGDIVRVIDASGSGSYHHGEVGTVTSISPTGLVKINDKRWGMFPKRFELVPQEPATYVPKIGDKVSATGAWSRQPREGVITEERPDVFVLNDSISVDKVGVKLIKAAQELKSAQAAPVTVKPGDIIKGSEWKHTASAYRGRDKEGVVSSIGGGIIQLRGGGAVWADNVELVKRGDLDTPCIVVRVDAKGRLEAASNPHIHANRADAEAEAKRLADLNRGQDFRVYSFAHLGTAHGAPVVKPSVQFVKAA